METREAPSLLSPTTGSRLSAMLFCDPEGRRLMLIQHTAVTWGYRNAGEDKARLGGLQAAHHADIVWPKISYLEMRAMLAVKPWR